LLLIALLVSRPVFAGAWLQEDGHAFLAYSVVYTEDNRLDGSLYAEYGLRPRLTLGLKVDVDMTNGQMGDGTAFVFARKPIGTGKRKFKLAYDFGLGSTFGGDMRPLLRTGLSYGRGFQLRDRDGWIGIDSAVEWAINDGSDTYKIDGTIGLALNDHFKVMVQCFVSLTGNDMTTTLAPSLIWQPGDKGQSFQFGLEGKDGVLALKIGMWRSF